jgi:Protein of unknown function (DUF2615)
LRNGQTVCTDNECTDLVSPQTASPSADSADNFTWMIFMMIAAVILYLIRPNSLRRHESDDMNKSSRDDVSKRFNIASLQDSRTFVFLATIKRPSTPKHGQLIPTNPIDSPTIAVLSIFPPAQGLDELRQDVSRNFVYKINGTLIALKFSKIEKHSKSPIYDICHTSHGTKAHNRENRSL